MDFIWVPNAILGPRAQGIASLFTAHGLSAGVDNIDPSDAPFNNRFDQWLPFDTTLKDVTINATAAPGVGKTENYRLHNNSGTSLDAIRQLTGTNQVLSFSPNVTLPALNPASDTTILATRLYWSAWVTASPNANGSGYVAERYTCPAHPEYQFYVCAAAHGLTGATFGAASQFSGIVDTTIATGQNTQAPWQQRMPCGGIAKFAYAVYRGWLNTSTVVATLQKGARGAGADTAIVLTMVGHPSSTALFLAIAPLSTEVVVASGDYLNWRIQRTAGAATTGFISLGVGFQAFTETEC